HRARVCVPALAPIQPRKLHPKSNIHTLPNPAQSKKYNSPHQAIGLIILALYVLQIPFGFVTNRVKKQDKNAGKVRDMPLKRRLLHQAHPAIGWGMVILAVVNAGLGFTFALSPSVNRAWIPLVIGVFVVFIVCAGVRYMWYTTRKDAKE